MQNVKISAQCETNAKRIRVCTGAEMKKMCAPKVCPCPRKSSVPLGVAGLVKFALKAALAGSIVYLTVQAGVWGKPETSEELYYTFYQMLLPKVCKDDDEDIHRQTFLDRSQHKELCEAYQGLMEYVSTLKFFISLVIIVITTANLQWLFSDFRVNQTLKILLRNQQRHSILF